MKRCKRAIALLLACVLALSCVTLLGCKKDGDDQNASSDNVGRKIICTAADFEGHKNTWYGIGALVGNGAESIHTTDLVGGEGAGIGHVTGDSGTFKKLDLSIW